MIIFFIILFYLNTNLSASSYSECELKVKILNAGEIKKEENGEVYQEAKFRVLKFISGEGHTKNFCKDFPEKEFTENILIAEKIELKNNIHIHIHFVSTSNEIRGESEDILDIRTKKYWKFIKEYKWYFF